jgi:hypothetical protein
MLPLVLAALCVTGCETRAGYDGRPVVVCWYVERDRCEATQAACVESPRLVCEPKSKSLGPWNPIPLDYDPPNAHKFKWYDP